MDANLLYTHQNKQSSSLQTPESSITVASLPKLDRETLAELILADSAPAIVDVRDSDYIGGHITGSTHVASGSLDYKMPELVRLLEGKKTVVFHCMLSQVRGPQAALQYMRQRESQGLLTKGKGDAVGAQPSGSQQTEQKVYVLAGGFAMWQEKYALPCNSDLVRGVLSY
jgi:rhodanese-related sulfurtransferase